MSLNQQVFTDAGITMLGAANAGGTLIITKIVVGSGAAGADTDLFPLIALITPKSDVGITRKTDLGHGKMIVSGALNEAFMTPGAPFSLRELGVMAKVGAGPEQLYSVSNVFGDPPDTVTPGGTSTHAFDITIVIDRATSVTVTIGDPNTVDIQNIPTDPSVGPGLYATRVGNVFQFKRLVAGPGIAFTEASDRVTVSQKIIFGNLNLYVPASNPNAPGPDVAFATLQDAFNYLNAFVIDSGANVFINIDKGTYTTTTTTICNHPNSDRIFILGAGAVSKNITAISFVDATHKNVTVDNTTSLVVGQRVHLADTVAGWAGGCKITAIAGLVVTCSIEKRDSRPAYTTLQSGGGSRLTYNPTVLVLNNPTHTTANLFFLHGIGDMQNLTLDGGSVGVTSGGDVVAADCAFWNSTTGLSLTTGRANLANECVFTQCDTGIKAPSMVATRPYFNGCTLGMDCHSSAIGAQTITDTVRWAYFSHNETGARISNNGDFIGGFILASTNGSLIVADLLSSAKINPAGSSIKSFLDNNGSELNALNSSYIIFYLNGGVTPSCNPPAEVLGNQNSLIHIA